MITPHQSFLKLATAIGVNSLYFKREDLHPLGSHKGRSIPHMIDIYIDKGIRQFAISSSGNAALAAGLYVQLLNKTRTQSDTPIELDIFAGKNISDQKLTKLEALKSPEIRVSIQERPLQALFSLTKDPKVQSLRQSQDDLALVGYTSLGQELLEIPELRAIFIAASSGTTAQALADFFITHKKNVAVNFVQTLSCHPLADAFETLPTSDERSIADAIVDHTALRKDSLIPLIKKTDARGFAVSNESIRTAIELTKTHTDIKISPNSALSVAGLIEATYAHPEISDENYGAIACIICGE